MHHIAQFEINKPSFILYWDEISFSFPNFVTALYGAKPELEVRVCTLCKEYLNPNAF
jgi:hypothetical protein